MKTSDAKKRRNIISQLQYTHRLWANAGPETEALHEIVDRLEAKVSAGRKLTDLEVRALVILVADINPWPN